MAETETKLNGVNRSAIFLLTMGQDKAAEVLKLLTPKEVQQVGAAVAGLGGINHEMVDQVLVDFVEGIRGHTSLGMDTSEFVRGALTKALGQDKAGNVIDRILSGTDSAGLEQLRWMDARGIADLIRMEHPQIIAIVISLLEPDQAAQVLAALSEKVRADIAMRIATLEGVQPAALKELDRIMASQLSGNAQAKASAVGGIEAVANILNFLDGSTESAIMEQIMEIDADIGEQIQDKMFVFDDLVDLDDRGFQTLLREVSSENLLLALKGADEALKEKIFRNMSRRAAEMLREDLEVAPPAKLSDVEGAQKEILAIARRLADAGEINLGGGGGGDVYL
ncbi:MAG: flagellar motor switch protein FliG [Methylococcaceae bacterium]|nr:MAG: flagellar motor switch protein FliG [Methylococcaceae bacterium]